MSGIVGSPRSDKPGQISGVDRMHVYPQVKQRGYYAVDVRVIVEASGPAQAALAVQKKIEGKG